MALPEMTHSIIDASERNEWLPPKPDLLLRHRATPCYEIQFGDVTQSVCDKT